MPRINRGDPAYETAMREAKALFDQAMAKSAMKGRGRPAAAKTAAVAEVLAEDVGVPGDVPADIAAEIVKAGGDIDLPTTMTASAAPAEAPAEAAGETPAEALAETPGEAAEEAEPAPDVEKPAAKKRVRKPRADKA